MIYKCSVISAKMFYIVLFVFPFCSAAFNGTQDSIVLSGIWTLGDTINGSEGEQMFTIPNVSDSNPITEALITLTLVIPNDSYCFDCVNARFGIALSNRANTVRWYAFIGNGTAANLVGPHVGSQIFNNRFDHPDVYSNVILPSFGKGVPLRLEYHYQNHKQFIRVWKANETRPTLPTLVSAMFSNSISPLSAITLGVTGYNYLTMYDLSVEYIKTANQTIKYACQTNESAVDANNYAANAPSIILDDDAKFVEVYKKAWLILQNNIVEPKKGRFVKPYIGLANEINAVNLLAIARSAIYNRALHAPSMLDNLYCGQYSNGYISGSPSSEAAVPEETVGSVSGLFTYSTLERKFYEMTNDLERVIKILPIVENALNFALARQFVVTSTYAWPLPTSGNVTGPVYDSQTQCPGQEMYCRECIYVDSIVQTAIAYEDLAFLLRLVEPASFKPQYYNGLAKGLWGALSNHWNHSQNRYVNYDCNGLVTNEDLSQYAALPLAEHNQALISRLQAVFDGDVPLSHRGLNDTHFSPQGYTHNGGVFDWEFYSLVKTLIRSNYTDLAIRFTKKYTSALTGVYEYTGSLFRCLAPMKMSSVALKPLKKNLTDGFYYAPCVVGTQSNGTAIFTEPEYLGMGPIALAIEVMLGIQIDGNQILWNTTRKDRHGILNLPVLNGTVSLILSARNQSYTTLCVNTTVIFKLTLLIDNYLDIINAGSSFCTLVGSPFPITKPSTVVPSTKTLLTLVTASAINTTISATIATTKANVITNSTATIIATTKANVTNNATATIIATTKANVTTNATATQIVTTTTKAPIPTVTITTVKTAVPTITTTLTSLSSTAKDIFDLADYPDLNIKCLTMIRPGLNGRRKTYWICSNPIE
ncbi:putative hydrolase protein [Ranid herpesvirus 3]|uniref:Putative hydrolase protein n=1 Tax=Ranid herpesvirus 3 TaxID=1987509 RepID=A0A1X9T5M8_9VIRU|nr:putative hydrolase protein [Ranid herpesvirus 3]ARR28985.1 putative hydrolase protein [Ranid herpesvirus 3]